MTGFVVDDPLPLTVLYTIDFPGTDPETSRSAYTCLISPDDTKL